MSNFREIVTKTIIGKGRKSYTSKYKIESEEKPNTVLGCWVINHRFNGTNELNDVKINGTFDVNVWYSYDNDSKTGVITKTFPYSEEIRLRVKDMDALSKNNEIIVRSLRQPTVQDVKIENDIIELQVEKELGVEIVGEGKVKIAVEEDELPWDEIEEPEEMEINEDYIEEK